MFNNTLNLVVAYTFNNQGIGKNDNIPWNIPEDIKYFKKLTTPPPPLASSPSHPQSTTYNSYNPYIFSIVIMGRKTWESIKMNYKPLQNRFNIILSNNENYIKEQTERYNNIFTPTKYTYSKTGVKFTTWDKFFTNEYIDVENAIYNKTLDLYSSCGALTINNIFTTQNPQNIQQPQPLFNYYIIGGEQIYTKALESKLNLIIYATEIYTAKNNTILCDTFFPKNTNTNTSTIINTVSPFYKSSETLNNKPIWYRFITSSISYSAATSSISQHIEKPIFISDEQHYLTLMKKILENGQSNNDRTGVGTLSVFGEMLKYDLRNTFPISTTKRIFFRAIFEELMLYLSGSTDNTILQDKGINVWNGNTSREFLDKRGLIDYEVGDMGQTYGFNMRHYGATYLGCKTDYPPNYGYDQLNNVINLIKTDPCSRRIIIDLWDPSTIDKAALPSCLCKYQFNVNVEKQELNLIIYLRSSDYFLANNWNTCTGALFVHLLCNLEGINLTPGALTVFIADAHIYKTHIEQVKQNLERTPYPFPKLLVCGNSYNDNSYNDNSNCNGNLNKKQNILDFTFDDLELIGYKSHPNISAQMAI